MPRRHIVKFITHKNVKQVNGICPFYIGTDWYQNDSTDLFVRGVRMEVDPVLKAILDKYKGGEPKLLRIREEVCCGCPACTQVCGAGICACQECKAGQFDTIAYTAFWVGSVEKQASCPDFCSILCPGIALCEFQLKYWCCFNNEDIFANYMQPAKDTPYRPLCQVMAHGSPIMASS